VICPSNDDQPPCASADDHSHHHQGVIPSPGRESMQARPAAIPTPPAAFQVTGATWRRSHNCRKGMPRRAKRYTGPRFAGVLRDCDVFGVASRFASRCRCLRPSTRGSRESAAIEKLEEDSFARVGACWTCHAYVEDLRSSHRSLLARRSPQLPSTSRASAASLSLAARSSWSTGGYGGKYRIGSPAPSSYELP
jgi:hypothetical protein